jgi:8-oxo-dGTP pyrophosphatase MutT (NUDIX family)
MVEVALAMVEQDGRWLLQLRDDVEGIVSPGCWGLFGGHLDPGEGPEEALRRELREEIRWQADQLHHRFTQRQAERVIHVFFTTLREPLESLCLLEGQDMVLASLDTLRQGRVWSPVLGEFRPLAASLRIVVEWLSGPS